MKNVSFLPIFLMDVFIHIHSLNTAWTNRPRQFSQSRAETRTCGWSSPMAGTGSVPHPGGLQGCSPLPASAPSMGNPILHYLRMLCSENNRKWPQIISSYWALFTSCVFSVVTARPPAHHPWTFPGVLPLSRAPAEPCAPGRQGSEQWWCHHRNWVSFCWWKPAFLCWSPRR